jgi:hypothetical protein
MNDPLYFAGLDLGQSHDFTALTIIVEEVRTILTYPPLDKRQVFLAVDRTGCGAPVCDLLRPVFPGMAAISITGGQEASASPAGFNVPKRDLASRVKVLMQTDCLSIDKSVPAARLLYQELQSFTTKINIKTGRESYEAWRESDKDDLILAVCLAIWLSDYVAAAEREVIEETAEAELMRRAQARPGDTVLRHLYL